MISKPRLHFRILRTPRRAGLKFIRRLLKRTIQTAPCFPAERTACHVYQHTLFLNIPKGGMKSGWYLYIPCLALSSENSLATSSNLDPLRSFSSASSFLEYFSHFIPINFHSYSNSVGDGCTYKNMPNVNRSRRLQATTTTTFPSFAGVIVIAASFAFVFCAHFCIFLRDMEGKV